jgi:3-hydroxyisobutyrate dehydrogenase-like beta-hydroxyacid dehydrogenase
VTKQRIGFVGVGAMGMPMAKRLLDGGHDVVFTSRRPAAIDSLERAGGRAVPTPLIVAEECELFLTCLPADAEQNEGFHGPEGVVEH